jgi:hypothetical protein
VVFAPCRRQYYPVHCVMCSASAYYIKTCPYGYLIVSETDEMATNSSSLFPVTESSTRPSEYMYHLWAWEIWLLNVSNTVQSVVESIGVMGMPMNVVIIIVFCRMKDGVAKSVRIYYVELAVFGLIILFWYHLLNMDLENLLGWLLGFSIRIITANPIICKLDRILWYGSEWMCSWTYVILCAERVEAITYPLISRGKFTQKRALLTICGLAVSAIPLCVLIGVTFSAWLPFQYPPWYCTSTLQYPTLSVAVRILIAVGVYALPNCISLILNIVLMLIVLKTRRVRGNMTNNSDSMKNARKETRGALTVVLMSLTHCTFFIPMGISATVYSVCQTIPGVPAITIVQWFVALADISAFTALAHGANFILYFWRIASFRRQLLSCCKC